jgi:hypothetical protein
MIFDIWIKLAPNIEISPILHQYYSIFRCCVLSASCSCLVGRSFTWKQNCKREVVVEPPLFRSENKMFSLSFGNTEHPVCTARRRYKSAVDVQLYSNFGGTASSQFLPRCKNNLFVPTKYCDLGESKLRRRPSTCYVLSHKPCFWTQEKNIFTFVNFGFGSSGKRHLSSIVLQNIVQNVEDL